MNTADAQRYDDLLVEAAIKLDEAKKMVTADRGDPALAEEIEATIQQVQSWRDDE